MVARLRRREWSWIFHVTYIGRRHVLEEEEEEEEEKDEEKEEEKEGSGVFQTGMGAFSTC
jgi:hypothetical protein